MLNLENISSPCEQCFIHGHSYSPDDSRCQSCEYNIAIFILIQILKLTDNCDSCKNVDKYGDCKFGIENLAQCDSFEIDWDAVVRNFQLKNVIK